MTTNEALLLGQASMSVIDYAIQANGILGIKESGKSSAAKMIAEQLLHHDIPFVAFDPIGVWRWMKVPGIGPGNKVVVAGGEGADLPLTAEGAPEIVRAAMRENIPLVLDLYDVNMSKADWRRIVLACLKVLLYENKRYGLRHVFIEEAAEFVPQVVRPETGPVYGEVEKLVRMGGNVQLGVTIIGLRPEDINKSVLELCDGLFLGRQKGSRSLQALDKWLAVGSVTDPKKISADIPLLGPGEFYVWPAASANPIKTTLPRLSSFHPNRRDLNRGIVKAAAATDVGDFVTRMAGSLDKVLADAKENDPVELKKTIRALEKELAKKALVAQVVEKRVEVPVIPQTVHDFVTLAASQLTEISDKVGKTLLEMQETHDLISDLQGRQDATAELVRFARLNNPPMGIPTDSVQGTAVPSTKPLGVERFYDGRPFANQLEAALAKAEGIRPELLHASPTDPGVRQYSRTTGSPAREGQLPKVKRSILVTVQQNGKLPMKQLAMYAGYSHKGTGFQLPLRELVADGALIKDGKDYALTPLGGRLIAHLTEKLPTGSELFKFWLMKLDTKEANILSGLVLGHKEPAWVPLDLLGVAAGRAGDRDAYAVNAGPFQARVRKLRALSLIEMAKHGKQTVYRASPVLFD